MQSLRLSSAEWIEKVRRGVATLLDGRRLVVSWEETTGAAALVEVDVEDPDLRCAVVDGQLEAREMARKLVDGPRP